MPGTRDWLSHGFKRAASRFEARAALGWGVAVALLALSGVSYLAQGSRVIVSSYRIRQLTAELRALQEEKTFLEAQIAAGQSVEHLQQRAAALGFVAARAEDIEYLTVADYPPAPELSVAAPPTARSGTAAGLVDWWHGLARGFTGWADSTAGKGF